MRTMMIASLLALTSLVPAPDAEACGGGPLVPNVFAVETHGAQDSVRGPMRTRRVAVVGPAAASDSDAAEWRTLAPASYDPTQIARAPDRARELALTLVGPSGTRVVSSKHQALLARTFHTAAPVLALEVDAGGRVTGAPADARWTVAVQGVHADAKWRELASVATTGAVEARVNARGLDPRAVYVSTLADREVEVLATNERAGWVAFVGTRGGKHTRIAGYPLGALELGRATYLVLRRGDGQVTVLRV